MRDLAQGLLIKVVPVAGAQAPHGKTFDFKLCESPHDLESELRSRIEGRATARLVASFARPWLTEGIRMPHDLPALQQDFGFRFAGPSGRTVWARPWNVIQNWDYSAFVQAKPGSRERLKEAVN